MNAAAPLEPKPGNTVHLLGTLVTFRATAAETGGAFSLVEVTTAPGQGTPPHLQRDDEEAFYVLEGEYEFMIGDKVVVSGPGAFHHVPRSVPHAFRNAGLKSARMLIINLPGGLHEKFFAEAGDPVADASAFPPIAAPDVPRIVAAGARYGIQMLPPA